jgi:hypothetical protein
LEKERGVIEKKVYAQKASRKLYVLQSKSIEQNET